MYRRSSQSHCAGIGILQVPELPTALKLPSSKRVCRKEKNAPVIPVGAGYGVCDHNRQLVDSDYRIIRGVASLPYLAVCPATVEQRYPCNRKYQPPNGFCIFETAIGM